MLPFSALIRNFREGGGGVEGGIWVPQKGVDIYIPMLMRF
jgi:hypothetical protein